MVVVVVLVFLPEGFLVLFFRIPLFSLGGHFFVHMDAWIDYIFIPSRLIVHSGSILYALNVVSIIFVVPATLFLRNSNPSGLTILQILQNPQDYKDRSFSSKKS